MANSENKNPFTTNEVFGQPWAYDAGFSIETVEPSSVVRLALQMRLIPIYGKVLDLGCCKNPRNAIFLAHQHYCTVDAIDLEQPDFPDNLPLATRKEIVFRQGSVLEFEYAKGTYQVAILARLIQYLSPQEMESLFSKVGEALLSDGIICLSYTAQGGILNKSHEYNITTFSHPIDKVKELLRQKGLAVTFLQQGTNQSTHVPHTGEPALTYDLIAQKS